VAVVSTPASEGRRAGLPPVLHRGSLDTSVRWPTDVCLDAGVRGQPRWAAARAAPRRRTRRRRPRAAAMRCSAVLMPASEGRRLGPPVPRRGGGLDAGVQWPSKKALAILANFRESFSH